LAFLVIALVYRRRLARPSGLSTGSGSPEKSPPEKGRGWVDEKLKAARKKVRPPFRSRPHTWLQYKSVIIALTAVVLFCTRLPLELVALGAASVLLAGPGNPVEG